MAVINSELTAAAVCCADTMHVPGFKLQARILHHLFGVAASDAIRAPLWDVNSTGGGTNAYPNNVAFVHAQLTLLLQSSFPNLRQQQVEVCCAVLNLACCA